MQHQIPNWLSGSLLLLTRDAYILISVGTPHVVATIGDCPARGLMVTAPSAFARLIAAVGTQEKTEKPDMALFARISAEIGDEILGSPGTLPSAATKTE